MVGKKIKEKKAICFYNTFGNARARVCVCMCVIHTYIHIYIYSTQSRECSLNPHGRIRFFSNYVQYVRMLIRLCLLIVISVESTYIQYMRDDEGNNNKRLVRIVWNVFLYFSI